MKQFAFITVENTVRITKTCFEYASQSRNNCIPNARYKIIRYEMRLTMHRPLVARVSGLSFLIAKSHSMVRENAFYRRLQPLSQNAFLFKTLSFNDPHPVHESDKSRATLNCGCDKSHVNHRLIPWKWLAFFFMSAQTHPLNYRANENLTLSGVCTICV